MGTKAYRPMTTSPGLRRPNTEGRGWRVSSLLFDDTLVCVEGDTEVSRRKYIMRANEQSTFRLYTSPAKQSRDDIYIVGQAKVRMTRNMHCCRLLRH